MNEYIEQQAKLGNTMEVDAVTLLMITTERILIPITMFDLQERLTHPMKHMIGTHPYTLELKDYADRCTPYLIEWYPELDADFTEMDKDNYLDILADWQADHSKTYLIAPLPNDEIDTRSDQERLEDEVNRLKSSGKDPIVIDSDDRKLD